MSDSAFRKPPETPPADLALVWLAHSHDLVAVTDADGVVSWANARFGSVTGLGNAVGTELQALLPAGPSAEAAREAVVKALQGEALNDAELVWQTPAGAPLCVRARTLTSTSGIVWILQDITQAVAAARRAERQTELLEMARKFGRMGIWERELPSGHGRWDRQLFESWGLDPSGEAPPFEVAAAQVHADDQHAMQAFRESTLQAGHYAQRYRVQRPDGSLRWIHAQWTVKNGPDGRPDRTIGLMMDDTEAIELARSLDDTAEQLALALDLGNIAIWRHDLKTHLMRYSDRGFTLLGLPVRAQGIPIDEVRSLIHPEDLPKVLASAHQTLASGQPTDVEARYLRSDGVWRYMMTRRMLQRSPSGEPLAFLGVALDVTEHREALAALRSADQRAALAARSAGIGTWEVDFASGLERWDDQMFLLRGLRPRERAPAREERLAMLHPDDAHVVLDSQRTALANGESSQYEFRVILPGGDCRWLASRSIPVRDAQGTAVRRVGVNWDVTESKNAQVILQEKALAERESRAKSQFLSRMSHELRTPLNAVLGFTQLLQLDAGVALGSEQLGKLGHIRTAGEHLLSLINDVLDLSSLQTGKLKLDLQPVELATVVAQALPLVESLAKERGVRLQVGDEVADKVGGSGIAAWADPTRVLQILLNLLSNAIKYNRPGGTVTIEWLASDTSTQLRVKDTGRGMTRAQQRHLFEPFNRLGIEREGIEGTGIGLVIVKALAEGMGGTLGFHSRAGHGTTFELNLPQSAARPAATTVPGVFGAAQAEPPTERRGTLLYIEDNAVNILLVEELVGTVPGLTLVSETTGHAGVQQAATLLPDLVLVDMQLPDFDGFEVLRRMATDARTARIPCIALSANAMAADISRALEAGFEDYWTKPIDFKAFISALEQRFPAN